MIFLIFYLPRPVTFGDIFEDDSDIFDGPFSKDFQPCRINAKVVKVRIIDFIKPLLYPQQLQNQRDKSNSGVVPGRLGSP